MVSLATRAPGGNEAPTSGSLPASAMGVVASVNRPRGGMPDRKERPTRTLLPRREVFVFGTDTGIHLAQRGRTVAVPFPEAYQALGPFGKTLVSRGVLQTEWEVRSCVSAGPSCRDPSGHVVPKVFRFTGLPVGVPLTAFHASAGGAVVLDPAGDGTAVLLVHQSL